MISANRNPVLAIVIVAAALLTGPTAMADAPADAICVQAESLVCLTAEMKDEIKCHFRGAKGYGRMLAANAVVKAKAAALRRRVNRNACYSRLIKDADRLQEQVCKLQELVDQALACSSCARPVHGDPLPAVVLLDEMHRLSGCIKSEACTRHGLVTPVTVVPVEPHELPPISEPIIIEPSLGEPNVSDPRFDIPRIQTDYPPVAPSSVLEFESDPILQLDPRLPGDR